MFTALSISSMDARTRTALRLASTPYTPMQKSTAARNRNWFNSIRSVPPGDGDGADQGGEQQDGDHLEGDQVGAEHRVGHVGGALHTSDVHVGVAVGVGQHGDHEPDEEERGHRRQPLLVVVEVDVPPDRRTREHGAEQEEDDDGADVDDDLDHEDELLGQEQILGAGAGQNDHQIQHRPHDVLGRDDLPGRDDHDGGQDAEDDVLGDHGTANLLLLGLGAHFQ